MNKIAWQDSTLFARFIGVKKEHRMKDWSILNEEEPTEVKCFLHYPYSLTNDLFLRVLKYVLVSQKLTKLMLNSLSMLKSMKLKLYQKWNHFKLTFSCMKPFHALILVTKNQVCMTYPSGMWPHWVVFFEKIFKSYSLNISIIHCLSNLHM